MFRLKDFRKENNLVQTDIAKMFGCSHPNIVAIEKDRKDLTEEQLEILSKKYGKDYVMSFQEQNVNDDSLPLIPFECIAGFGEDNVGIKLSECEQYNIPEFKNIGAEFLVRVGGSSMYPKYSSGDILACKKIPIEDITFFQWGKVYVIDSSQGQLVKRICEHEDNDKIWLESDNKEKYKPFDINKSDIRGLSIVLGVVRME